MVSSMREDAPPERSSRRRGARSGAEEWRRGGNSSAMPPQFAQQQQPMQWAEDGDEEDEIQAGAANGIGRRSRPSLAPLRRTSSNSSGGRARSSSIPQAPPTLEGEGFYDDVANDSDSGSEFAHGGAEVKAENVLGGWHFAPLLIAVLPPLGAVLGGHSDAWSDAILLAIASFWLYQFLKIPHDIYHAARTRRILQADAMDSEAEIIGGHNDDGGIQEGTAETASRRRRLREQQAAAAELRRAELISLVALVLSPLAGAWLLTWLMETFSDGNRYLNKFNIRLFMLASGIRPWTHALSLFRRRLLHLQEVVHYPSSRVEGLTRRLIRLESDLSTLRKLVATKSDVTLLRDGIDLPLSQLSRSMRRYERKEENLRLSAEDKFGLVESRLEDLLRETAINAELIEEERRERQRAATLPASIFQALKFALGRRGNDYYGNYDQPRGLAGRSSLGIQAAPDGHNAAYISSANSSLSQASTSSADSLPGYSSPPRYGLPQQGDAGGVAGPVVPPHMQAQQHQMSLTKGSYGKSTLPGWTEEGLAYWVFLPINIPRSVMRSAMSYATGRYNTARDANYAQGYHAALTSGANSAGHAGGAAQRGQAPASQARGLGPSSPRSAAALQQQQSRHGKAPARLRTGGPSSSVNADAPSVLSPAGGPVSAYGRRA